MGAYKEPVVWVDEITPMTGPEVKDLLEENETLKTKLRKAYEEADRKEEVQAFRCHLHSEEAREEGAAVAFGVVGMGEAIRSNLRPASDQCARCWARGQRPCEVCNYPLPRPTTCGAQSPGDDEDPPVTCTEPKGHDGKHAGGTRCGTLTWENEEEW